MTCFAPLAWLECSFTHCLDHEGFMTHQTPGLVIIRRVSSQSFNPSSVVHSSLKVQTFGMVACTISVHEESSNVFHLIDKKLQLGLYIYVMENLNKCVACGNGFIKLS